MTTKQAAAALSVALLDDYWRITGRTRPLDLARWLHRRKREVFDWMPEKGTRRYACSLAAPGGIRLAFGLAEAGQSREPNNDRQEFCLDVPGQPAAALRYMLSDHPEFGDWQAARRDIAFTFRSPDPAHVYRCFAEYTAAYMYRPAHRIGPDGSDYVAVSLQTHEKQAGNPRFAILYHKHAQNPQEYPDPDTLRIEFRFQPEKKEQKQALLAQTAEAVIRSWRYARSMMEILLGLPLDRSYTWQPRQDNDDLEHLTLNLVRSYGSTIARGLDQHGAAYLHTLALAVLLQTKGAAHAPAAIPADISAPQLPARTPVLG